MWQVLYSVTYPYLLGSVFFTIGCYLAWVEVRLHLLWLYLLWLYLRWLLPCLG